MAQNEGNYMYRCSACDSTFQGSAQFSLHFRRVGHDFPLLCGQGPCNQPFDQPKSLMRHIRDSHIRHPEQDHHQGLNDQQGDDHHWDQANQQELNNQGEQDEGDEDEAGADQDINLTKSAAKMILNLRRSGMTSASIIRVQDECFEMMQHTSSLFKIKLMDFFRNEGIDTPASRNILEELTLSNPFTPLRSLKQQLAYFAGEMGLVVPEPSFLDYRCDYMLNPTTNQYEPTQVPMTFQYVPIIETLKLVLSNQKVRELIASEQPSQDGVLRSYLDGSRSQNNDLIRQHPTTLRIQLNWDDLEVVNPLGSKTSIHKLAAFYFSFQNLPPVENSQLSSIYLLALAYSEDIKSMKSFEKVLAPFLADLKKLESEEGVLVNIGGKMICIRATLTVLCADTLAAHEILGFLPPQARHFCRYCMISRQQLHVNCNTVGERRTEESHQAHVDQVKARPALSVQCGVERPSPLSQAKYFSVTEDGLFDIFHDLLEGVCHLDIFLALHSFIVTEKFFTIVQFNARVTAFNYGVPDRKNKPSVNITEKKLKNLKSKKLSQSGIQMWCFTRAFGFLVPEVPEDNPHLRLVNLLQEIMVIVFSREIRPEDIDKLGNLITSHHALFQELHMGEENRIDGLADDYDDEEEEDADDPVQPAEPAGEPAGEPAAARAARPAVKPINKLHHMKHYEEMIRRFGPPILYWCARYEGRHHIFCKYAAVCCNFINLPKTMAQMHQISTLSGVLNSACRAEEIELHSETEMTVAESEHSNLFLLSGFEEGTIVTRAKSVVIAGEDFRRGLFVIVDSSPCFGLVQSVYAHEGKVYFVVLKWETEEFERRYCAYRIKSVPDVQPFLLDHQSLGQHGSYAPWNPFNCRSTYISPRFLIF